MSFRFKLFNEDAIVFLRRMRAGTVDLMVTDVAYESMEKHRSVGTTTRLRKSKASSNEWFEIFGNDRFEELFVEAHRVLKKNAHFYFFSDMETMWVARPVGEAAGFRFWKDIIWDKVAIGMGYHYRSRCERILFFEKGKRKLNNLGTPDVLEYEGAPDILAEKRVYRGYPTEKPVPLLEVLVTQSSSEGELVVDPFCGSGSAGVAAMMHGRRFIGNDKCAEAVGVAGRRISEAATYLWPGTPEHGQLCPCQGCAADRVEAKRSKRRESGNG